VESLKNTLSLLRAGDRSAIKKVGYFLGVGVIAIWVLLSSVGPANEGRAETATTTVEQAALYVDIVGEVVRPGVYPVEVGTRLFEVVSAAGGFTEGANQKSINLARLVTDGEQILVLGIEGDSATKSESKLLSLNAATALELENLPGVGPKLASRIIDWRAANGGFTKIDQLLSVGGIGDKLFAGIRNMVRP
jgi:competence protein ComEA